MQWCECFYRFIAFVRWKMCNNSICEYLNNSLRLSNNTVAQAHTHTQDNSTCKRVKFPLGWFHCSYLTARHSYNAFYFLFDFSSFSNWEAHKYRAVPHKGYSKFMITRKSYFALVFVKEVRQLWISTSLFQLLQFREREREREIWYFKNNKLPLR